MVRYQLLVAVVVPHWHDLGADARCTGEIGEFQCITAASPNLWSQRCISIVQVCDGFYDCEDHSDEWDSLCSHVKCRVMVGEGSMFPGFSCSDLFYENSTLFDATGNASAPLIAGNNYNYNNHTNDNNASSKMIEKSRWFLENNQTDHGTFSSDYSWTKCISLSRFCDGRMDCSDWDPMGETLDERYCTCDDNPECNEPQISPDYNWCLRILAT